MTNQIVDELDRAMLALLRVDGRMPVTRLAVELKVSRVTVEKRIQRLLDNGTIIGFTVRDRQDGGPDAVRAMMMIEVSGKATSAVIKHLKGLPELRSLHTTNGAWDLVAEIRAPDLTSFDRVLREVRLIDGVENSETSILLTTF